VGLQAQEFQAFAFFGVLNPGLTKIFEDDGGENLQTAGHALAYPAVIIGIGRQQPAMGG
jgi:hypothetical protein